MRFSIYFARESGGTEKRPTETNAADSRTVITIIIATAIVEGMGKASLGTLAAKATLSWKAWGMRTRSAVTR